MTNDGITLPDDQFKMYPVVNSNGKGTLLYREETPVSQFENQMIYTSNTVGESDSFRVVYTITPQETQKPGSYYGRVTYLLVPVDSTQSQVVVNLNIYVQLVQGDVPVVEMKTETGVPRLVFSSRNMTSDEDTARAQQQVAPPTADAAE